MKGKPSFLTKKHMVITCIMEITSKDPFLGRIVRGYYLEELLEHGDLAMVYRARTEELWQVPELIVTILLVPNTLTKEARNQFTIRFMEKGRKLARLRHPHLHPLYGYGEQEGFFYLLTPPVQGETLAKRLLREGPWNAVDVLSILLPLVSVVDYLHNQALVCKFLNPAHVWLQSDQTVLLNGRVLAQLLIMQALNQETIYRAPYEHLKSISGTFLGAPEYLAPEVVKGAEADNRSDTYALGILLFELLSGSLPFSGKTYLNIAQKHLSQTLPSLHEMSSDIPVALDIVINRASHYSMRYRFQTATELADAYARIINVRFDAPKPGSLVRAIQQVGMTSVTNINKVLKIDENSSLLKEKTSITNANKADEAEKETYLLKEKNPGKNAHEASRAEDDSFLLEGEDTLRFEEDIPEDPVVAPEENAVITPSVAPNASLTSFPQEGAQSEALTEAPYEKRDVQQTDQATMHARIDTMASQFHQLKERLQAQAMAYPTKAPPDKN